MACEQEYADAQAATQQRIAAQNNLTAAQANLNAAQAAYNAAVAYEQQKWQAYQDCIEGQGGGGGELMAARKKPK